MTIAAVVLAAGRSSRSAPVNKLLHPLRGRPLVIHAVEAAIRSVAAPVIVVIGHEAAAMRAALVGLPVTVVENEAYARGLSGSLRTGLLAVPADAAGAVILLGDMPRVRASHVDALIDAFDPAADRSICVPTWQGQRGNPVLWPAACFPALQAVTGDAGGRTILKTFSGRVHAVPMPDDAVLFDVDNRNMLETLSCEQ